jgi:hypothetical protein
MHGKRHRVPLPIQIFVPPAHSFFLDVATVAG